MLIKLSRAYNFEKLTYTKNSYPEEHSGPQFIHDSSQLHVHVHVHVLYFSTELDELECAVQLNYGDDVTLFFGATSEL